MTLTMSRLWVVLIFHHFLSFQQLFFASKWPNSSRNAKKKFSIFGDPTSYSAPRQAFYVKILNIEEIGKTVSV